MTQRWRAGPGTSSQFCIQWHHVINLQSAIVGIATQLMLANATYQCSPPSNTMEIPSTFQDQFECILLLEVFIFSQLEFMSPFFVFLQHLRQQ